MIVPPPEGFSLPKEHVEAAFRSVMAEVAMGCDPEDLLEAWQSAIRSGDPRVERDALLLHLGHHGWRWPELDRAAARFAPGRWPLCWNGLVERPYSWADLNPLAKIKLLQGGLHLSASASKMLEDLRDPFVSQVYRIGLWGAYPGCPVDEALLADMLSRGEIGTRLPPFFPGSGETCVWSADDGANEKALEQCGRPATPCHRGFTRSEPVEIRQFQERGS